MTENHFYPGVECPVWNELAAFLCAWWRPVPITDLSSQVSWTDSPSAERLAGRGGDVLQPLASLRRSPGLNDSHGGCEARIPHGNIQVEIISSPEAAFWSGMSRFLMWGLWQISFTNHFPGHLFLFEHFGLFLDLHTGLCAHGESTIISQRFPRF